MTESTNTDYANAISWLCGANESTVDGASCALKRSGVLRGEVVGNLVQVRLNTDVYIISL